MPLILSFLAVAAAAALLDIFAFGAGALGALLCFALVFVGVNALYFVFLILAGLSVDVSKPIEAQKPLHRKLAYLTCSLVAGYFGVSAELENGELFPKDGRFLLVSNHRSAFDPLAVISLLPELNISFICKPSIMRYPPIKTVAHGAGFLAIDRENDRNALKTILTAADYLKRGICSVGIYPEGTRTKDPGLNMLPFHAGSFKIAQKAGVPVVIMSTEGTEKVMKNFPLRRTKVKLKVLELIPAETVKKTPTAELAEHSRAALQAELFPEKTEEGAVYA